MQQMDKVELRRLHQSNRRPRLNRRPVRPSHQTQVALSLVVQLNRAARSWEAAPPKVVRLAVEAAANPAL